MAVKARRIVQDLFEAFLGDTRLLPGEFRAHASRLEAEGPNGRHRAVADYVAGMTDRFAIGEHRRIFDASALT
jgi:dGTPase